jgi:SRSO17 transposase
MSRATVSLSVTTATASLPVAWRLYLPESRAQDPERRETAGVLEEISFATKPAIALEQIRRAVAEEIPMAPVLGDAGYGNDTQFREGVTGLSLRYVLGVSSSTTV